MGLGVWGFRDSRFCLGSCLDLVVKVLSTLIGVKCNYHIYNTKSHDPLSLLEVLDLELQGCRVVAVQGLP